MVNNDRTIGERLRFMLRFKEVYLTAICYIPVETTSNIAQHIIDEVMLDQLMTKISGKEVYENYNKRRIALVWLC